MNRASINNFHITCHDSVNLPVWSIVVSLPPVSNNNCHLLPPHSNVTSLNTNVTTFMRLNSQFPFPVEPCWLRHYLLFILKTSTRVSETCSLLRCWLGLFSLFITNAIPLGYMYVVQMGRVLHSDWAKPKETPWTVLITSRGASSLCSPRCYRVVARGTDLPMCNVGVCISRRNYVDWP